ncbi:complement factor H-like isoform 4-T4 [Polymixia lowei]
MMTNKINFSSFGFLLLIWFPGAVNGVSTGSVSDLCETGSVLTTIDKCGEVPTLANGVVTTTRVSLTYQCNSYYKLVGSAQVVCFSDGSWSNLPTCEGVSTGSVRDPSGTRPATTSIDKCGELPTLANGVVTNNTVSLTYQCNSYYKLVGSAQVVCFSNGSWSNLPTCKGVSTGSVRDPSGTRPSKTTIDKCGELPTLANGVVTYNRRSLTYQCNNYYKLVGSAQVVCFSDGSWSNLPTCEEAFCIVNTAENPKLQQLSEVKYLMEGTGDDFNCLVTDYLNRPYLSRAHCENGIVTFKRCCSAPNLDGGFVVPERSIYPHGTKLTYACDTGNKPAVEGWCATSTCQNNKWSPEPKCIDERYCLPPNIPNAKYKTNAAGWYEETKIRITCDEGYMSRDGDATAECKNGTWTSIPICEKSMDACDEPPKMPHAVIIQRHQTLFGVDSKVLYKCEDGYVVEGRDEETFIYCISGNWTASQPCRVSTSSVRDPSGTRPTVATIDKCGEVPTLANGVVTTTRVSLTYQCNNYYKLVGSAQVVCFSDGSWSNLPTCKGVSTGSVRDPSGTRPATTTRGGEGNAGGGHSTSAGHGTQPVGGRGHGGGGVSTSSVRDPSGTRPATTTIDKCGEVPTLANGVVTTTRVSLTYQCNHFYKLVGLAQVVCFSDGSWSNLPTCEDDFCLVNTAERHELQHSDVKYLKEGTGDYFNCLVTDYWNTPYYSVGQCKNGIVTFKRLSADHSQPDSLSF